MHPIDTYRDSFLKFVADGMTHEEALEQFDENALRAAAMEELDTGLIRRLDWSEIREDALAFVTNDEREMPSLLDILAKADSERRNGVNGRDYAQALELWQAGWTSEAQRPDSQVMSWYWRRPPRRKGKPGRLYLSTNQAFMAMQREADNRP